MSRLIVFLAAVVMVGCKPNDANVKTVKERVDAGEMVVFSEPGTKLPNCRTSDDWVGLRLIGAEQARVVVGKQRSVVNPGNRACYRIGSRVLINEKDRAMGTVTVQSIGIARLDLLKAGDLKGNYFKAREEFDSMKKTLATRMKGNTSGYVYVVNLVYDKGSAVNEKAIWDEESKDGYEETKSAGDTLDRCNTWTTIEIPVDFHQPILDGKVKSFFKLGHKNCVSQGSVVEVKERLGLNYPVITKVRIKKVKRFKVWALDESRFDLNGYDFKIIQKYVKEPNLDANEEVMTVMDFELVGTAPAPLNCPPAIHLSRSLTSEVRLNMDSARCANEGSLTEVVTDDGKETLEIPVRVKSRKEDAESETVILEFERLDNVQGEKP